jgi:hypothetical protein
MTLDTSAMAQLQAALDMARLDMKELGKLEQTEEVIVLAERYAAFLLCGEAAKDVTGVVLPRSSSSGC